MVLNWLDLTIIITFLGVSLVVGYRYHDQAGRSLGNYFLGGRKLPWYLAGISMVATTFATDTPLVVAEIVAINGISGNWLWWNAVAGGMMTAIFFAKLWHRSGVLTEAELVTLRYGSKPALFLRPFKGIYLGLIMNVLIMGWVNLAMISIIEVLMGVDSKEAFWIAAAFLLIVGTYSMLSGLKGIVVVDALQFSMAMIGSAVLAYYVMKAPELGGIDGLVEKLEPHGTLDFFPKIGVAGTGEAILTLSVGSFLGFFACQWWASWYPGAEPGGGGYVVQRMMATKDENHALKAGVLFQILHYCIRPWPWVLVGLAAIILYPELDDNSKRLGFVYAVRDYMPAGVRGILVAAFVGAYMSTMSTQINWGASLIVNDVVKPYFFKGYPVEVVIFMSRVTVIILMIAALYVTTLLVSIKSAWEFMFQAGAGLGLVLILRWYWWRVNVYSEIAATIAPFLFIGFFKFVPYGQQLSSEMGTGYSYITTVGGTTFCWLITTWLTPPESTKTLQKFYRRVRPNGLWSVVGHQTDWKDIGYKVLTWLGLTGLVYSVLLLTGYFILYY